MRDTLNLSKMKWTSESFIRMNSSKSNAGVPFLTPLAENERQRPRLAHPASSGSCATVESFNIICSTGMKHFRICGHATKRSESTDDATERPYPVAPGSTPFATPTRGDAAQSTEIGRHSRILAADGVELRLLVVAATRDSPKVDRGEHERSERTVQK